MKLLILLSLLPAAVTAVDIPNTTRRFIEINAPIGAEGRASSFIDARLPSFSATVQYTGKKRNITAKQLEMLQRLAPMQKRLAPLAAATELLELSDARGKFWVIGDPALKVAEATPGTAYLAEMTFVGCCLLGDKENTYILHALGRTEATAATNDRAECRIDDFFGFSPGGSLSKALALARSKYKIVKEMPQDLGKMTYAIMIDDKKKIFVYLTDGGPDQKDYVHAVQFSVYRPVQFPVSRHFQFGMTFKELNKVFEFQLTPPETTGEYAFSKHNTASCSFEFTPDGNLFSVRYFTYE